MSSKRSVICHPSTSLHNESISMHPSFQAIVRQLCTLKQQSKCISQSFEQFRELVTYEMNKSLGKLSSLIQRQLTTNNQLNEELSIVKYSNQTMKKEVVQLREMIEQFVKSYNTEIEAKDAQIRELKARIGVSEESTPKENNHFCGTFLLEEEHENGWKSLQVIQQVSQHTASRVESVHQMSITNSVQNTETFGQRNLTEPQSEEEADDERNRKRNSFLNFFRKNVDQSVVIESNEKGKESHSASIDDLNLGDTDKINVPKTTKSPQHMQNLTKQSKRCSTEQDKENAYCVELQTMSHRRNNSHYDSQQKSQSHQKSRSNSKGRSKQKIKLASKIIDENHNFNKTNRKVMTVRPSVHLGGKMYLRKLAKDIRTALQQYNAWEGIRSKEVKYEGEKRNGMRWGKGKLLYDNGFEYDGSFVHNYRHGIGTVSLNGIVFYEGQWSLDELSGHGYVKSMKNYSDSCPKPLSEASYCGQLLQNKLHGMGTLFVNQNQKFVGKFVHGVPIGDFTYYNLTEQSRRQKLDKENNDEREVRHKRLFERPQIVSLECSNFRCAQPINETHHPSEESTIMKSNQPNEKLSSKLSNDRNEKVQLTYEKPFSNYIHSENACQVLMDRSNSIYNQQSRRAEFTDSYAIMKFKLNSNEHQQNTAVNGTKVEQYRIEKSYEGERKQNIEVKSEKQLPENESSNYGKIKRLNKSSIRTEAEKKETNYDSNFHTDVGKNSECLTSSESDAKYATQIPIKLNNRIEQVKLQVNQRNMQRKFAEETQNMNDKQNVLKSVITQKDECIGSRTSFDLYGSTQNSGGRQRAANEFSLRNSENWQQQARRSLQLSTELEQQKLRYNTFKDVHMKEKQAALKQIRNEQYMKMDKMAKKLNIILQNMNVKSNEYANTSKLGIEESNCMSKSNSNVMENNYPVQFDKPTDTYLKQHYTDYGRNCYTVKDHSKGTQQWSNDSKKEIQLQKAKREEDELRRKYQSMKDSLGLSKHIPSEIILQESSSEMNSQVSPRAQLFHLQLMSLFNTLDEGRMGELSKSNCANHLINNETKCLLEGIFNRITENNERMSFKKFVEECQYIDRQSEADNFRKVLNKEKHSKRAFDLKLNAKDTQSERENTNNGSGSKISSGRSQVVKKYEFLEAKPSLLATSMQPLNEKNNKNDEKVHCTLFDGSVRQLQNTFMDKRKYHTNGSDFGKQFIDFPLRSEKGERNQHCQFDKYSNKRNIQCDQMKSKNNQRMQQPYSGKSVSMSHTEKRQEKRKFQLMCENLNSKLDNYLTTITRKQPSKHCISLQFSQLYKHWNTAKQT